MSAPSLNGRRDTPGASHEVGQDIPATKDRTLTAILACPPTTSGVRTARALAVAVECLGYERVVVANLLDVPAPDTTAIPALVARQTCGWQADRASPRP